MQEFTYGQITLLIFNVDLAKFYNKPDVFQPLLDMRGLSRNEYLPGFLPH